MIFQADCLLKGCLNYFVIFKNMKETNDSELATQLRECYDMSDLVSLQRKFAHFFHARFTTHILDEDKMYIIYFHLGTNNAQW